MKLIPVVINGKIHRLSERALELLNLEQKHIQETPIELKKLPPDLSIIRIEKKEPVTATITQPVIEQPVEVVEVKKKEDVIVASASEPKPAVKTNPKRKSNGRKVGAKK